MTRVLATVDRQGYVIDDHGRRIAKLEDKGLDSFMTEMRLTLANLASTVQSNDKAMGRRVAAIEHGIGELKPAIEGIKIVDADEAGAKRANREAITYKLIPLISVITVLLSILALVLRGG